VKIVKRLLQNINKTMKNKDFDLQYHLRSRFPILFTLLNKNAINWASVTKTFVKFVAEKKIQFEKKGPFKQSASIYPIIIRSMQGDPDASRLLDFFQKLFEELDIVLSDTERGLIIDALQGVFSNMDFNYLNFIGELSVLNLYKRNSGFELLKTEAPVDADVPKGITIDFLFRDHRENANRWIEVVNIHLNENNTSSYSKIDQLLSDKIESKISAKAMRKHPYVYLIPVVWGQYIEINGVIDYLEHNKYEYFNSIMPTGFMTFTDQLGNKVHLFGTLDTLTKNVNISEQ
jgi:hypothetical protein